MVFETWNPVHRYDLIRAFETKDGLKTAVIVDSDEGILVYITSVDQNLEVIIVPSIDKAIDVVSSKLETGISEMKGFDYITIEMKVIYAPEEYHTRMFRFVFETSG